MDTTNSLDSLTLSSTCSSQAFVNIRILNWQTAKNLAIPIRQQVFIIEQLVPAALELDAMDALSIHAIASVQNEIVGTGRLLPNGHIGRMAVKQAFRNLKIGSEILKALMLVAKNRGDPVIVINAQVNAIPFYQQHGFVKVGEMFEEAGIMHVTMQFSF